MVRGFWGVQCDAINTRSGKRGWSTGEKGGKDDKKAQEAERAEDKFGWKKGDVTVEKAKPKPKPEPEKLPEE